MILEDPQGCLTFPVKEIILEQHFSKCVLNNTSVQHVIPGKVFYDQISLRNTWLNILQEVALLT